MSAPLTMTIKNNLVEEVFVIDEEPTATNNKIVWSGDTYSRGLYEIKVTDNNNQTTERNL